jgi:hypothetical protein
MEPTIKKHSPTNLAHSLLSPYRPQFSYRQALARGAIVDITSWTQEEARFGKRGVTVRVAVTSRLWNLVVKTIVEMKYYNALYGKDQDVVHLAARALERARRAGLSAANYHARLAAADKESDCDQTLRVEYQELNETTGYVVIGFPDEFATL